VVSVGSCTVLLHWLHYLLNTLYFTTHILKSLLLFICTVWNAILQTADIQSEKLIQEKVRSMSIIAAWQPEVVLENQEGKKVLALLGLAPLQIKLGSPSNLNNPTTPWYLWNTHLIFLNEYTGQTNLIRSYVEKKCLKILVVYKQGVPGKKSLISLVMYTQKWSVEEQCLLNLAVCIYMCTHARTHTRAHTHTHTQCVEDACTVLMKWSRSVVWWSDSTAVVAVWGSIDEIMECGLAVLKSDWEGPLKLCWWNITEEWVFQCHGLPTIWSRLGSMWLSSLCKVKTLFWQHVMWFYCEGFIDCLIISRNVWNMQVVMLRQNCVKVLKCKFLFLWHTKLL